MTLPHADTNFPIGAFNYLYIAPALVEKNSHYCRTMVHEEWKFHFDLECFRKGYLEGRALVNGEYRGVMETWWHKSAIDETKWWQSWWMSWGDTEASGYTTRDGLYISWPAYRPGLLSVARHEYDTAPVIKRKTYAFETMGVWQFRFFHIKFGYPFILQVWQLPARKNIFARV